MRRALERRGDGLFVIVVRLAALGDVLRTLPAVRVVRAALPAASIAWAVDDRWSGVLDGHPDIDARIEFPRRSLQDASRRPGAWATAAGDLRRFVARLRSRPDDRTATLVVDFHGNLRSGLVAVASGARARLGFDGHQQKEGNRWLTTHRVPSLDRRESRTDRNLRLIAALGLPEVPAGPVALPLGSERADDAVRIVRETLGTSGPYAVLSPGASVAQAYKRPPPGLLAEAAVALADRGIGALVVWGPGEEDDARRVATAARGSARVAPPTSLPLLAALIRGARLFVGGDTGPLHLACAVGCPVVGLYGPTDPQVNAPWGVPRSTVHPPERRYTGIKRLDRGAGGFAGIPEGRVARAIAEVLTGPR